MKPRNIFDPLPDALKRFPVKGSRNVLSCIVAAIAIFNTPVLAQDWPAQPSFPDTDTLMSRVASHQKDVEALLTQYTLTDKTTLYTLDKAGTVRSQHTDTYYITPTPHEIFTLHISHDGKPISQANLQRQQNEIAHRLESYQRKAQQNPGVHPKDALLFADIMVKSQFNPLRWDKVGGASAVFFSFAPKSPPIRHGSSNEKLAGDMKGTMWINPETAEVVRMEFSSVSALGLNFLVNVKNFQGFVEQRKVNGEAWLPSRQDFVAQGRELVKGF